MLAHVFEIDRTQDELFGRNATRVLQTKRVGGRTEPEVAKELDIAREAGDADAAIVGRLQCARASFLGHDPHGFRTKTKTEKPAERPEAILRRNSGPGAGGGWR